MNTFLFTVENVFELSERGCVLAPGPSIEADATVVRQGDKILLVLPSGATIETQIRSLENIKRIIRPKVLTAAILLPREIKKVQVPIGTRVYLICST